MNPCKLSDLRDWADQLTSLGSTFQWKQEVLKAQQMRRAEKQLIILESCFADPFRQRCEAWQRAYHALIQLQRKKEKIERISKKNAQIETEIKSIKQKISSWMSLTNQEKIIVKSLIKDSNYYIESKSYILESHVIHQYRRYVLLQNLLPYCDNADYLCDSINHFNKRDLFEKNIESLKLRIQHFQKKIETVQRGFWLAAVMCCFIITIPICAPFVFTLWNRRKELERDLSNSLESMRREEKRLNIADESVIAVHEIRTCIGEDLGAEEVRKTLLEVKELHTQFRNSNSSKYKTIQLLNSMSESKKILTELFGEWPDDFLLRVKWINTKASELVPLEQNLQDLFSQHLENKIAIKDILRNKSIAEIEDSIELLRQHVIHHTLLLGTDLKSQLRFATLVISIHSLLRYVRQSLSVVSQGQHLSTNIWNTILNQARSKSNELSLLYLENALDSEIAIGTSAPTGPNDKSEATEHDIV